MSLKEVSWEWLLFVFKVMIKIRISLVHIVTQCYVGVINYNMGRRLTILPKILFQCDITNAKVIRLA